MGIFGRKTDYQGHNGYVGTDGMGQAVAIGMDGVEFDMGGGYIDPVDSLTQLAGQLADMDEEN